MARAIVTAMAFLSLTVQSAHAEGDMPEIPASIQAVAESTGTDPVELAGAVNSTGMDPETYLCHVGEGPCPKPAAPVAVAAPVGGVWDSLAHCEATDNWAANTGNGYFGGLQEDMTFWRNYGGMAYASRPDLASRSAQIAVAQRGLAAQGWGAWPRCSRILGLR